jgi:hypothetical protein
MLGNIMEGAGFGSGTDLRDSDLRLLALEKWDLRGETTGERWESGDRWNERCLGPVAYTQPGLCKIEREEGAVLVLVSALEGDVVRRRGSDGWMKCKWCSLASCSGEDDGTRVVTSTMCTKRASQS